MKKVNLHPKLLHFLGLRYIFFNDLDQDALLQHLFLYIAKSYHPCLILVENLCLGINITSKWKKIISILSPTNERIIPNTIGNLWKFMCIQPWFIVSLTQLHLTSSLFCASFDIFTIMVSFIDDAWHSIHIKFWLFIVQNVWGHVWQNMWRGCCLLY